MKKRNWRIWIGFFLVVLSAVVYIIHFLIFRDSHHIFIFLVADIGFVFIEVLLVTLIIDQLLHQREKRSLLHKLNMIIGVFFSEGGSELLRMLSEYDPQVEQIRQDLVGNERWNQQGFSETSQRIRGLEFKLDSQKGRLEGLRDFLKEKKDFFLRILENPNLLEHEKFTDILWAVLHLAEELTCRRNLQNLPPTDYAHLAGDMGRAYRILILGWLDYMLHLKTHYPYLFSLAIRTNPFDPQARPEVTE
jgi:hypothetical protein